MNHLFDHISLMQADPIFASAKQAKDAGSSAINASIGILMNEVGVPVVLPSIQQSFVEVTERYSAQDFSYPPLQGVDMYLIAVQKLLFGKNTVMFPSIATTGGTGALSILMRLGKSMGVTSALLPVPAWANYHRIIENAGLALHTITASDGVAVIQQQIESMKDPAILLLQSGAQNPTGHDYTDSEWDAIIQMLTDYPKHILLLDIAYQGLAQGIEKDVHIVQKCVEAGISFLIAWSASKNHSLYSARTGLACAITHKKDQYDNIVRHLCSLSRALYSIAPSLGQHILAHVQSVYPHQWKKELEEQRSIITKKRRLLAEHLPIWTENIQRGTGLFTLLPLSREQIALLQIKNVFLTYDGRVNISGLSFGKIGECAEKILSVL